MTRVLALVWILGLAACGVEGDPTPPEGANPKVQDRGTDMLQGSG